MSKEPRFLPAFVGFEVFVAGLLPRSISPNMVTTLGILCGLVAVAYALWDNEVFSSIIAAITTARFVF